MRLKRAAKFPTFFAPYQEPCQDVLDRLWNDSRSEGSSSDSDSACGDSSDSESEVSRDDSAETSESVDAKSAGESQESEDEPLACNNTNPRRQRKQPHQDQLALLWTPAKMLCHTAYK